MSTFLQLLKETGVRCGEACQIKWADLDLVNRCVRVTPEKGSDARNLKMSGKLVSMLNELPKTNRNVLDANSEAMRKSYQLQRKRIAFKLKNPRLLQVTFHTFRHWKATMEYHKTKDILHVKYLLGHKQLKNTEIYTHLINFESDDWHVSYAKNLEEETKLIEAGFEYVRYSEKDEVAIYRKRV
jgi:integrase/recombinase XerD